MNPVVPLTIEGLERLQQEIRTLEESLAVIGRSKTEALESGGNGWHENAAFEDLVERERELFGRLGKLMEMLQNSTTENVSTTEAEVGMGATVTLTVANGTAKRYMITDPFSVDVIKGYISYESPIGKTLMGKKVGDTVMISKSKEPTSYVISAIEYR
jgi:transcription elongation factor GreA